MTRFTDMLEGYRRFRDSSWIAQHERWNELREGQSPKVMVIACSDSRVDPAQIFDVNPGEIFVVRNVAALVPPFETTPGRHGVSAALEFAVQVIKGTALASIIGFVELTKAGTILNNVTYQPFKVFGLVALGYFLLCYPLSRYSQYLEKKFNAAHHH